MKKKRTKRPRSFFLLFSISYALIAVLGSWFMGDRMDPAIISLILFGLFPVVMAAWIADAVRCGEIWRQGPRSITSSLTMNQQRITRSDHPIGFWLMISLTVAFALAISIFVLIGIYVRLVMWH